MKNLEILIKYVRIVIEGSQMTELILSCPRFMRNLTSQRTGHILCPPRIPMLAVHWSVIGLGDTGRHCPVFARLSLGKGIQRSGWTIAGQSICLIFDLGNTLSGVRIFG